MDRYDFDELNMIDEESMRSIDYDKYFGEMDLTDDEKEKRISLAEKLEDGFLFVLALILTMRKYEEIQWETIEYQFRTKYKEAIQGVIDGDDYINNYINQFSAEAVQSTQENIDDDYTLSYDRARFMSENEVNLVCNHQQLVDAINAGKTKKTWVTMRDRRVRHTHSIADGQTVRIAEPFMVGDSLMMVPKDTSIGASSREIVNCRCTVKFK